MRKKIIVTDKISPKAIEKLEEEFKVDVKNGLSPDQLKQEIGNYDGILIRSATKLTSDIIDNADNLKVIGRAGVGVDNVDLESATKKGITVVNAPMSNTITVAEHTIALLLSLAREIPRANYSLKSGKWEKSTFKGIELYGKTLGIVGFGKIGALVAERAMGMGMKIAAFDPFVSEDRFKHLGITRADKLEDIYSVSDFITIHLPKNKDTIGMFGKEEFYKMKKGTIILNVARGGIIVEKDLAEAIKDGQLSRAAIDVYESEPCIDSPLFKLDEVICTPHLGAATAEAQDKAGITTAEQMAAVLNGRIATFAVNVLTAKPEAMDAISPFFQLCENMGSLFADLFGGSLENIEIGFYGKVSEYDTKFLSSMVLVKILKKYSGENVNLVNVNLIAKENGLKVKEVKSAQSKDYVNLITLKGKGKESELSISGTIAGKKNKPRFIAIDKFEIDMVPSKYMAFIRYRDVPGQIGKIGVAFGELNVNIASMHVGRKKMSGDAVMGLNLDCEVTTEMIEDFKKLSGFKNIKVVILY